MLFMKKNIQLILALFLLCVPSFVYAATDNIFSWDKQPLDIEGSNGCYLSLVKKFKGNYYTFQGKSFSTESNDKIFVGMTSHDGVTWQMISEQFGKMGDTDVIQAAVLKNSQGNEHLYVSTTNREYGTNVYRTSDGKKWDRVIANGLDSKHNDEIRGMVVLDGTLFFFTENDVDNNANGSKIFTSRTGKKDDWQVQEFPDKYIQSPGTPFATIMSHRDSDGKKTDYIYILNGSANIYRTSDGITWELVPFFEYADFEDLNSEYYKNGKPTELIQFDGYIYAATFGQDPYDWTKTFAKVFRAPVDQIMNEKWEELDTGVSNENLYHKFARKIKDQNAKYLYFGSYPSMYVFRIGKQTKTIERISEAWLGWDKSYGIIDEMIFRDDVLTVYSGSSYVYTKEKK